MKKEILITDDFMLDKLLDKVIEITGIKEIWWYLNIDRNK